MEQGDHNKKRRGRGEARRRGVRLVEGEGHRESERIMRKRDVNFGKCDWK